MKTANEFETEVEWLPTGLPQLDRLLGGGIPWGRIMEVSGAWSSGKTTLALMAIAEAQKRNLQCIYIDAEWSFDGHYARTLGVDTNKLFLIRARDAESALDEVLEYCEKGKNTLMVLDAVGALHPRDEAEKDSGGRTIGGQSALVARFCRKIVPLLYINKNALVVLNHEYTPIMNNGGRPTVKTSGGAKLEYHKSIWLRLMRVGKWLVEGERKVGFIVEAEVRKNKCAPTERMSAELQLLIGQGFSATADLLLDAIEAGVVEKRGQLFFFAGEKLARGMNATRKAIEDSPELQEKIQAAL